MKKQDFKVLKTKDLYPFPDNPFHVAEDETLSELAESIKEFGIVTPISTRPKEDGDGYEVIAGQRRVRASELAGINTVPAFVLPLQEYGFALFFRQSTDCFKKQLRRDFLPGFLKDGFNSFPFEIFIKGMKLPRFV